MQGCFRSILISTLSRASRHGKGKRMTDSYNKQSDFIPTGPIRWDSSWPGLAKESDRHALFSYMEGRFGIPYTVFDDYFLFEKQKSWWLFRKSAFIGVACRLKVSMVGIKAFQRINNFVKPTTKMIRIFGGDATRARLNINEGQLQTLAKGQLLPVKLEIENGYVILDFKGHVLGLGLLIDGTVRSQIPKKDHCLLATFSKHTAQGLM